jgi:transposase-like protein
VSKSQKGKIPSAEWPAIAKRHRQGETLASIARAYGCTAPAIAYIVKRSGNGEAREPAPSEARTNGAKAPRTAEGGLDYELRERVNSDVAAFLVAFEAACEALTSSTCQSLLDATDRLLRAGARTRIELERWTTQR